ncbi:MAG: DUF5610 domain-containing protein [Bdellovibrionales bacterium]|nr:DUF5610 domain-containing protein [Bdellovibrionales bacterium]
MDGLVGIPKTGSPSVETVLTDQLKQTAGSGSKKASSLGIPTQEDSSSVGMGQVYKSLTILADEIVAKLDELLRDELPEGIRSLAPEDHTPERTAERIVDGATALFGIFSKQNPNLEGEELITSFMTEIRSGIQLGYDQAASILGDLGAFEFDGVQAGIEETMRLVEEKLVAFENEYRKQNGLAPVPGSEPTTEPEADSPNQQGASALTAVA